MGQVKTTITVTNHADEVRAKDGTIKPEQIRAVTLDDVLVDTGATVLCLPAVVIQQLGLEAVREVAVSTANGYSRTQVFEDAKIALLGREGTFECIELPGGERPLLGVVPLEAMGIELDLQKQALRLLPNDGWDTYMTAM
jgi:clan AA aspartic protease